MPYKYMCICPICHQPNAIHLSSQLKMVHDLNADKHSAYLKREIMCPPVLSIQARLRNTTIKPKLKNIRQDRRVVEHTTSSQTKHQHLMCYRNRIEPPPPPPPTTTTTTTNATTTSATTTTIAITSTTTTITTTTHHHITTTITFTITSTSITTTTTSTTTTTTTSQPVPPPHHNHHHHQHHPPLSAPPTTIITSTTIAVYGIAWWAWHGIWYGLERYGLIYM